MSSRLTFDPRNHAYRLAGLQAPGVTTAIGRTTAKPGLPIAAAEQAAIWALDHLGDVRKMGEGDWIKAAKMAHRDVWDQAKHRGTFLHDAARALVAGEELSPFDEDGNAWPPEVRTAAQHLARFMDDFDVQPLIVERPVFHETDRWAGTVDLVARLSDGRVLVLDYKTGKANRYTGHAVYPEHAIQLAAYRHASHYQHEDPATGELTDLPMVETDGAAVVWAHPEGYQLRPVRADASAYDVFLHMLPVAEWAGMPIGYSVLDPLEVVAQ
jgi:hypothetical protein